MAILDVPYSNVVNMRGNVEEGLRSWVNNTLNENTSYAALYGNWLEVYDKWNAKYRWIPASGHVAGVYANTDAVNDPWFAPAGLNRSQLRGVRRLAFNPKQAQRDHMYKARINPIVGFAGQGQVVWGQKTLLDKESAFNRVNVRRLFIVLEKAISTAAKYFLFEPNDPTSRMLMVNMIDPFLRDVKSRRGINKFLIVCDETNNTAERQDRNEMHASIFISPTRAAEFLVLTFVATKTGVSFTEIAGSSLNT
jgi:phage tail sheath protein FI